MDSYEAKKQLARKKLTQAELAMDSLLHSSDYDPQRCEQLLQDINSARRELLDALSCLWPAPGELDELGSPRGADNTNPVPDATLHL
jgi:hypothetical protein